MNRLALMLEAERRGLLGGMNLTMLEEARARNLVKEPVDKTAEAIKEAGAKQEALMRALIDAIQKQKAPIVNVPAPVVTVQPQNIPAPVVNVPETVVNVEAVMPKQDKGGWSFKVERTMTGYEIHATRTK